MCEFKIKIADTVVAVSAMFESTKRFCAKYAVDSALKEDIAVTVNEAAIEAEGVFAKKTAKKYAA